VKRQLCTAVAAAAMVTFGTVAPSPASAATTNDDIVQAWYRVYLGRSVADAAGDAGRSYWVGRLNAGETREAVLDDLLVSREYVSREIGEYYDRYLGRDLDSGAKYWIDGVVADQFAAEWAAQLIVNSDEYYRTWTAGASDSDAAFIRSLYYDLLHRSASDGDVSYWRGQLSANGRFAVVRGIWYADEGVQVRVDTNYRVAFGRGVDNAGFSYWKPIEISSDHTVRYRLGATEEFAQGH
jgi:hypothetical protein